MAISPPSDIVLDVARAVEPTGFASARAELAKRSGPAGNAAEPSFSVGASYSVARDTNAATDMKSPDSFKRFEAMVLQTFIQNMLPKEAENVYGKGVAGDMWKSMLAGQLADTMAERGGIGIADRILGGHYMDGKDKVAIGPISGGPGKAEADQQQSLSTALVQELQRKLTRDLTDTQAPISATTKI